MLVRLLDARLNLLQIVHTKSLVLIFSKPTHLLFDLKLSVSSLPFITNGYLLIYDWCFRILKGSKMQSLDSDKRCC